MITGARRRTSLLAIATLLLAACGSADDGGAETTAQPAGDVDLDTLTENAQSAGTVTCWYSSDADAIAQLEQRFHAATGVNLDCQDVSSGEQADRIGQEATAGQLSVDVLINSDFRQMEQYAEAGYLVDVSGLPAYAEAEANFVDGTLDDPRYPTVGLSDVFMAYNPENVDEAELPTSYEDLLDSRWRGQLSANDPSIGLGAAQYWINIYQTQGEEFFEQLGDQDVAVVQASQQSIDLALSGSRPLALQSSPFQTFQAEQQNLPLVPWTGYGRVAIFTYYLATFAEGPNPDGAQLFANWLMTEDGQCALACGGILHASDERVTDDLPFPEEYEIFTADNTVPDLERTLELFDQHVR